MMLDRERQEAIDAGERALDSLYGARRELASAGNWGLVDLFGGGLFSTFAKHSKMDDAQRYMEQAKRDLGATIFMVTHDSFAASYTERVLFIRDGKLWGEMLRGSNDRKTFLARILAATTRMEEGDSYDA